jgi:hypothetical protein
MAREGSFTGSVPPPTRAARKDWDALVRKAQRKPGEALLAAEGEKASIAVSLRARRRAPFVQEGGHLLVQVRNSSVNLVDGKRYGDIYLTWIDNDSKETD